MSPAVLSVLPAVLRLQHLRPTDQRLLHLHGTRSQQQSTAAPAARGQHGAARHNPAAVRMRLPLRPAPDAPRPLHLRHRGLVSAALLHAERWRAGRAGGRRSLLHDACTECERMLLLLLPVLINIFIWCLRDEHETCYLLYLHGET